MRIVIDLQACQSGTPADINQTLELAKIVMKMAGTHDVWIALNNHFSQTINPLHSMLKDHLPDEQIVIFDIPEIAAPQTDSYEWTLRAAEHIRAGFLASLNPDIVFSPYLLEASEHHVISAIVPELEQYLTIFMVSDSIIPQLAFRNEAFYRHQTNLQRAAKIIVTSESVADSLRLHFQGEIADVVVNKDAETILATMTKAYSDHHETKKIPRRAKLALVSPLPPMKSGIADYSVELLHELARYYDVELIVDQPVVSVPWIKANFTIRSLTWFEAYADEYDHVLYHFGNSALHQHMFDMLERYPGVVVLHDFFLSNVLEYIDNSGYAPGIFSRAMYQSHGLSGLIDQKKIGHNESIWKYPCNKIVLDHATGVIVHSAYSRASADSWYGKSDAILWRNIPLIRGIQGKSIGRKAAREKLGFSDTDFVVCSFGMMLLTKCNERLLDAWLNSLLASEINCYLVFVGENDHGAYGEKILEKIALHKAGKHITITGFVSHDDYCCYLSAADLAVQLRTRSRGESSASVLDCLLSGLPTIVNSHGAVAELPDDILLKLDDQFSLEQLSDALNTLWQNAGLRAQLSRRASAYIETHHAPLQVGKLYYDAIEFFDKNSPKQHYKNLLKSVSRIGIPDKRDLATAAIAIAANQPPTGVRQLLVDISVMVQFDHRTGIQRVVRSILTALIDNPPCGYRVEPVFSPGGGEPYRYAHRHVQDWLQCAIPGSDNAIIEVRSGDIFLGLDLFLSGTQQNESLLQLYKNRGVKIYFVVYDILPVLRPDVFPEGTDKDFSGWLHMISRLSHGLVCISKAVSDELSNWVEKQCPQQKNVLTIDYFHLGADINASQPSTGLTTDAVDVLDIVKSRPSLIMVGTLEPRKGHAQVLAAFDLLWAEGIEINLVIVGKNGWMVDDLVERLQSHPENGRHLLWPQNVSDEMLLQLYETSTGLLAASEGEGFGLPLIEAAQHRLPIIARKLPVFMEVMGEHAFYFDGLEPDTLTDALRDWLQLYKENKIPRSDGMHWLTWEESAQQLLDSVLQRDRNGQE